MDTTVQLSPKQTEYIRNAKCRWNFKIGATQCGKTFIDVQYVIAARILERVGKKGLNVILGVSKETIERNVLEPMRDIWGDRMISQINSRNFATLFGEKVYCLGAEKVTQVSKLRGAKFKYCYVDEIVDINEQVFQLLKSRLSLPYSCCDASGNPSFPAHFVKKFIDSAADGVDIYCQNWTLYDNPFLDPGYVKAMEAEYQGTVFFDRYVLGRWTRAEGLIYPMFPKTREPRFVPEAQEDGSPGLAEEYGLSIDYGTMNAFAAVLWAREGTVWHATHAYRYSGRDTGIQKTDEEYKQDLDDFVATNIPKEALDRVYLDGGLTTIIDPSAASFIALLRQDDGYRVRKAKNDVIDGIRETASCFNEGIVKIAEDLKEIFKEFEGYVWEDTEGLEKPIQVNDHLMDAIRYFVKTMGLVRPQKQYKSVFGGI